MTTKWKEKGKGSRARTRGKRQRRKIIRKRSKIASPPRVLHDVPWSRSQDLTGGHGAHSTCYIYRWSYREFSDPLYWPCVGDILRRLDIAILLTHVYIRTIIFIMRPRRWEGTRRGKGRIENSHARARTMRAWVPSRLRRRAWASAGAWLWRMRAVCARERSLTLINNYVSIFKT